MHSEIINLQKVSSVIYKHIYENPAKYITKGFLEIKIMQI